MKKKLKINNNLYNIFLFILFMVTIIMLHPEILKVAYLHAEDGTVFVNDYLKYGLKSFVMTQGGYFCTVSRIFALISVIIGKMFNSITIVANTINILSIIYIASIFTYFCSNEFDNLIKSRYYRILISIIVIILGSNFYGMLYNGVGIHWWSGVLIFIVCLNLLNGKLPSLKMLPLILTSIVSSASTMILAFSMLYYLINRIDIKNIKKSIKLISKKDMFIYISMGLFLIIQAYGILFKGSSTSNSSLDLNHLLKLIYYSGLEMFQSILFILGVDFYKQIVSLGLGFHISAMMWLIIYFILHKEKKSQYFYVIALSIFFTYFMIYFKNNDVIGQFNWLSHDDVASFYNMLPAVMGVFIVMITLYYHFKNIKLFINPILFMFICLALIYSKNIDKIDTNENVNLTNIEPYVDFSSDKYATVSITPYSIWYVYVPVKKSYCKENLCVKKI